MRWGGNLSEVSPPCPQTLFSKCPLTSSSFLNWRKQSPHLKTIPPSTLVTVTALVLAIWFLLWPGNISNPFIIEEFSLTNLAHLFRGTAREESLASSNFIKGLKCSILFSVKKVVINMKNEVRNFYSTTQHKIQFIVFTHEKPPTISGYRAWW